MAYKSRKLIRAERRKFGVRAKIVGTSERPRLTVFRSLKNITAQIVDDEKMITLAFVSTLSEGIAGKVAGKKKTEAAAIIGEEIARRALEKKIDKVAFDRNRFWYHGRVKSLADAARKAGLKF